MRILKWILGALMIGMFLVSITSHAFANNNQPKQNCEKRELGGKRERHLLVSKDLLQLLKLDEVTFNKELNSGKTLLEIAESNGVTKKQLTDFYVNKMNNKVDQAVKDGKMTQEQAAWMKKYIPQKTEMFITKPNMMHKRDQKPVKDHIE